MRGEYARDIQMCENDDNGYRGLNPDTFVDNSKICYFDNEITIHELSDMIVDCPYFELYGTYYNVQEYKILYRNSDLKSTYNELSKEEHDIVKESLINIIHNNFFKFYSIREYLINGGYNVIYMCRGVLH